MLMFVISCGELEAVLDTCAVVGTLDRSVELCFRNCADEIDASAQRFATTTLHARMLWALFAIPNPLDWRLGI